MSIRAPNAAVVVAGKFLPITTFDVSESTQGEFGQVKTTSSIAMWRNQGITPPKKGDSIDVFGGFDDNMQHVFSGAIDECEFCWGKDTVEISGRDHAAVLSQSKGVMSKYQYKNQSIGKIVKQIAKDYGLEPDVDDPGILAGSEQHGQHHYLPNADNPWSLIQQLARFCGYHAQVTKDKVLKFKKSDESEGTVTATWGAAPGSDTENKLFTEDFKTSYQLNKNGDVKVKVVSYLPSKVEKIVAEATAKAEEPGGGSSKKSAVGEPKKRRRRKARASTKASEIPTITVRRAGLTQEAAEALAKSIAKDVAKRQIIQSGSMEFQPDVEVRKKLKIKTAEGFDIMGFDSIEYIISERNHKYSSAGIITSFKAQLRPEVS